MEEEDGWNFSAEELDSMEQTAKRQIAERGSMASSSSSASHHLDFSPSKRRLLPGSFQYSPSKGGYYGRPIHVKIFQDRPGRIALETQYNQVQIILLHVSSFFPFPSPFAFMFDFYFHFLFP